jgi:signal transduction histidine kinase
LDYYTPSPPGHADPSAARAGRVYPVLAAFLMLAALTTFALYANTRALFRRALDERLRAVAAVAATAFDPADLDLIRGPESVPTVAYRAAVLRLQHIREQTPDVRYAYILRPTADRNTFAFVADADSRDPDRPTDLNGDGVINAEDALTRPGDPYDVSTFPAFRTAAFVAPFVDPELAHDQWGTFLSGTAPIGAAPGRPARYVLGLDLDVTAFQAQTNRALVPFALFVTALLATLTALALVLRRMWRAQVRVLAEVDRQKDELLGLVAHQLAAPVTAVGWTADALLAGDDGPLTAAQRSSLGTVRSVAAQLGELVGMILDVSRVQLGRVPLAPAPLDVLALVREVLDVVGVQARQKGVALTAALPEVLPAARLDRRYTRMAVENVLANAVKYTPAGGSVRFAAERRGDVLRCTVRDTGCGIPAAERDKVFGKLYRASNVRDAQPGNGLGLYVAKGAVEAQGGRIWFDSAEGKGTTFYLELPIRQ